MVKQAPQPESKAEEVCKHLRALAYEKGPGSQLPTVRMLCDELGTTYVTLGEALNQLETEGILYRKQRQGIFVSPTLHHKSIHILFESSCILFDTQPGKMVMSPFWSMLWVRLEHEAQRRAAFKNETYHFHLIKHSSTDGQSIASDELSAQIGNQRIDGMLAVNVHVSDDYLIDRALPCVAFASGGRWIVQFDGLTIGQQAATTLLQQGCKKIGVWVPTHLEHEAHDFIEVAGVRQALETAHLPFSADLVRQFPMLPFHFSGQQKLPHQEQGYMLAREVFAPSSRSRPDGLFIIDDLMTDGALVALDELGLRVGTDVKIATHANAGSPILFGRTRNMTVLEYDPDDVVQAMFGLLDLLLSGQEPAEHVAWLHPRLRH